MPLSGTKPSGRKRESTSLSTTTNMAICGWNGTIERTIEMQQLSNHDAKEWMAA
jgi:hypothetical protein